MPPKILGIVNITEDSFSDGGRYLAADRAIEHAVDLVAAGADIIDLGPASSHPDAKPVTAEEEIRRIAPVMKALTARGIAISVDSFLPQTQRCAMHQGAAFLNDIQGFPDAEIYPDLARNSCRLIVMHAIQGRGIATRTDSDPDTIVKRAGDFFQRRIAALEGAGIGRERLILDPGMGFFLGNQPEASLRMLRGLKGLRERFGLPVLVSVSRKSFLRAVTGQPIDQSGAATLAAELFAASQGADFIRTHDAASLRDGLKVWSALLE
ncbi:MAG TPA: dihydropteroate synthase [Alphaproteobacteria bacterium]|nr:dihydropteroate synthase [Alphaproteobacteria bacterium]